MPLYPSQPLFKGESTTFKLCEFYRTRPIVRLKQHLDHRWKFNQRCECCGESPLHLAVRLNSVELINVLASVARIDRTNKLGQTALHVACEINNDDMAARLLDLHANPLRTNLKGETCMFVCMRKGHIMVAEAILRKTNANLTLDDPEDHLMMAIRNGSKDFVELFLKFKANIDYVDKQGNSAISVAVELGHEDILDCLLKHGADITRSYTKERDSLLHLACKHNRDTIVKKLLFAGASVHATNSKLEKPLHVAVKHSSLIIVHMLLTFNSDIEAEDSWMRTPLYLAILHSKTLMVKYLLSHGASTKTVVAPLIKALEKNQLYMIKLLVSHGLSLNQKDRLGQNLLGAAIKYGNIDIMHFFRDVYTSRGF